LPALEQLPKGISKTYEAVISRINARTNPAHVKIAMRTLKWITFAREPLQTKALLHALAVEAKSTDIRETDLEKIERLDSLCAGLVSVSQEGDEIRLVHETAQTYLDPYFRDLRKEDGNVEMAEICLQYLSFPAFSRTFEEPTLEDHLIKYRLSSYASKYWFVHVRESGLEEKLLPVIIQTFENQKTRDSVFQIAEYVTGQPWFKIYAPSLQLLHVASLHGLCILSQTIIAERSTKMERL
jgi:hypothetical protein